MNQPPMPALPCMCASTRRAARALTQHYERALRPLGLSSAQFTALQVLSMAGEMTQGELGQILAIDSTTLTRTLELMGRRGWIDKRRGEDRREWQIRLTQAGKAQLKCAMPHWQKVQTQLRSQLGKEDWETFLKLTNKVTATAIA
jgi:DNA-binding MarR family transcriptional regulator